MNEENNFNTVGEPSTINTPVTPMQEPVVNSTGNNTPKKGGSIKAVVVILIILLLGAIGYILYTKGIFGGEKKPAPETEEKEKKEVKEQNIKFDFSPYEETAVTEPKLIGTLEIKEKKYEFSFLHIDCTTGANLPQSCVDNPYASFVTILLIDNKQYNEYDSYLGIKEISVLDDRYVLIDTGNYGDSFLSFGAAMLVLDSQNGFKKVENVVKDNVYAGYNEDKGNGKRVDRNIGYVDSNTFIYGTFEDTSNGSGCSQKYIEYTVKVKDGNFTKENTFSIDGVQCSAQCR